MRASISLVNAVGGPAGSIDLSAASLSRVEATCWDRGLRTSTDGGGDLDAACGVAAGVGTGALSAARILSVEEAGG